jgi:hypothetical protein
MEVIENLIIGIQNLPVSVWIREAFWPFPVILAMHISGMALAAGTGVAVGLRLQGLAPGVPLAGLARFRPITWLGAALAIVSGLALFMSYPAKAITNWPFVPKLLMFAAMLVLGGAIQRRVLLAPAAAPVAARWRAAGLILILGWVLVIAGGRILAYTYDANNLLWYPRPAEGL